MTSLLTNNGAMVALQTLKNINSNLSDTQGQISTGRKVDNAKQNAAVWAISKTMESDVSGFDAISESLSLGQSTVAVARQATETVTDLLNDIRDRVISATGDNVDRTKLGNEITALQEQINSVVGSAQFNGLNLVNGSSAGTDVLSSLDRSGGTVTPSTISVTGVDLGTDGYVAANAFGLNTDGITAGSDSFAVNVAAAGTTDIEFDASVLAAGDTISLMLGEQEVSYTVTADDLGSATAAGDSAVVALAMKSAIESQTDGTVTVNYDPASPDEITLTNGGGSAINVVGQYSNADAGDLADLGNIDITTSGNARNSLALIEGMISTTIDASAAFGTVESRIETQNDFVGKLTDSFKSGIGAMVDADMEEVSARLQALQVQQQLATQSLSIANQAPQQLLSLFR